MNLDNIGYVEVLRALHRKKEERRKMTGPLDEEIKQLEKVEAVVHMYIDHRNTAKTTLATPQDRTVSAWMAKYPYLALYKGVAGCQKYCSDSMPDKDRNRFSDEDEKDLERGGVKKRMDDFIRPYLKDKEHSQRKASAVSAKRPVGAVVQET